MICQNVIVLNLLHLFQISEKSIFVNLTSKLFLLVKHHVFYVSHVSELRVAHKRVTNDGLKRPKIIHVRNNLHCTKTLCFVQACKLASDKLDARLHRTSETTSRNRVVLHAFRIAYVHEYLNVLLLFLKPLDFRAFEEVWEKQCGFVNHLGILWHNRHQHQKQNRSCQKTRLSQKQVALLNVQWFLVV
jgi:hypothetical protein